MRNDLTGKRFRKLVARCIDWERSGNGKIYWICDCDCGGETSVQSTSLTRKKGGTISCGCARNSKEAKEKARITHESYPEDITGYKFGRLTAIRQTDMKSTSVSDNGAYLWECKCDCGGPNSICYYSRYRLIGSNPVQSCGCLYEESRGEASKKYNTYDLDNYDFGVGYADNGTYFFFKKEDYDKIKEYCWWYDGRYVIAHTLDGDKYTTKNIRMHRVVMDIGDREDINVDHKNLIRYDCRKCNLRRADDYENSMNKNVAHLSPTGVVGVRKQNNKWAASIKVRGKSINLGLYDNFDDAVKARTDAEIKLFGEFRFDLSNKDIIDEDNMDKYRIFAETA